MSLYTRVHNKKRTAEEWELLNPTLHDGELIFIVSDSGVRFKIGDGISDYATLPFTDAAILDELSTKLSATVSADDAGKVLGVAVDGSIIPVDTLNTNLTWGDVITHTDEYATAYTDNLKLKLPGYDAPLDVKDLNANFAILDTLDSRVSNLLNELTSNPDYASTAEVIDIRSGYDGILYDTAGDAVRSLGADLLDIKDSLQTIDPDDLGLEQDEATMLVYPTFKGVRSVNGIPLAGGTGGGGGGITTVLKVRRVGDAAFTVALGSTATVAYTFSSVDVDDGTSTGNGTASYYINDVLVLNQSIPQGDNEFNVTPYLVTGANTVQVTVSDADGNSRSLSWDINIIEIKLTSSFDYTIAYPENVTFKYTATGDVEKLIHFVLDGVEQPTVTVTSSGKQNTTSFTGLTHGLHTLDVYATAVVNGSLVTSNHLKYDVIVAQDGQVEPIISINYNTTAVLQGELVDIPYIIYDPTSSQSTAELTISYLENGIPVVYRKETYTVGRELQHWTTRNYPVGTVVFTVALREKSRSVTINVSEFKLPIEPVTNDLELLLSAAGRSNNEINPAVWEYNGITTTFNNVNWASSGWINDENGDTALHLGGGSSAVINFMPFSSDLRVYGKTLEFEFAVRDVNNRDANVISCMADGVGINITADSGVLRSDLNSVSCHFRDERKMRIAFTIESTGEDKLMAVYIDGVMTSVFQYGVDDFQQRNPVGVTIGSPYCTVDLYTVRSYSTALNHTEIIGNYMCDIPNILERAEVYDDNDLYDDARNLVYDKVKTKLPVMTIIGPLPQSKGDKKDVYISYHDPDNEDKNFTERYCKIDVQGTSSQWYVRKNYKLKFNEAFAHIEGEIATKVYCMKADYAEATSTHNTGNANIAHTLYSEPTPAQLIDARCRTTIEGFPCVIFHQESTTSTPYFLGKYNFNYDKSSEEVFGFTDDFDVESWEFCNNTSDACNFLGPIPAEYSMLDENNNEVGWVNDFERRYPDHDAIDDGTETPSQSIARFRAMHDWVVSTKDLDVEDKTIVRIDLVFDEDGNPVYETDTEGNLVLDEDGNPIQRTIGRDNAYLYREAFEKVFNVHYCLVYYVWTFFFLMVDQRAKNMFMTYWAEEGRWSPWLYDNDTCLGINNEGQMTFDFYHEDTDMLDDGTKVYNGQDSVLWNKFRVAFAAQIEECYRDLRSNGKLTYETVHKYFVDNQSEKWSEAIYNEDSDFKYISMLREENDAGNLYQVRGTGEHHLEYFLEGRLNYCDSKWYAADYANDFVVLRINTPEVTGNIAPNANITVTPFSHMYAGVRYRANGTLQQQRVARNESYVFIAPASNFNDTETAIYGASQLSSIGDLAPLYCNYCDVSKATKLIELKLGDEDPTYESRLAHLSLGTNRLLKRLDIRNCKSLITSVDLSECPNIEEVYAEGSSITGLTLGNSGYLKVVHLPDTTVNLYFKNQHFITDFEINGYNNIRKVTIENTPGLPIDDIVLESTNLERVRFINVKWETTEENLAAVYAKLLTCDGLNEKGDNIDGAVVSGVVSVPAISNELLNNINRDFPELMVSVAGVILCTVTYYNSDGTVLKRLTVEQGKDAPDIVADGTIETPVREATEKYRYTYRGWSADLTNIQRSTSFIAMYSVEYGVSFYNEDVLLYREYVDHGDGLDDPIGIIAEPHKDSTISHTYTYVGWDREFNYITDAISVYAVFEENIRSYQVDFYNEDQLLESKRINYGDQAIYTGEEPTKLYVEYPEDYKFLGWEPGLDIVQGDTAYYAKFSESNHILDDWATVKENIANGTYKEKYPIGIMQRVPLSTGEVIDVELVGYDHDSTESGDKAALTFIANHVLADKYYMYESGSTNSGGWAASTMRTYIQNTVIPMLPEDLVAAIEPVVKTCSLGGAASEVTDVTHVVDSVWIPALNEINGDESSIALIKAEGDTYEFYATGSEEELNDRRSKNMLTSSNGVYYWLRTPVVGRTPEYWSVTRGGNTTQIYAGYTSRGVVIGFCIN